MSEPSDTITLPIGIEVDGKRHRTVIIDEMTGIDEEILANPKHKQNPGRAITNMLQRVILEIPGVMEPKQSPTKLAPKKLILDMYQPDRDAILIGLRRLSFGNTVEAVWKCERCGSANADEIDLSEMEVREWDEDEACVIDFELPRGIPKPGGGRARKGSIRFPRGTDTERVSKMARNDPGGATSALLAALIQKVEDISIDATVTKHMSTRDRQYLGRVFREQLPGVQLVEDLTCPDCGHYHPEKSLELSGFFAPT